MITNLHQNTSRLPRIQALKRYFDCTIYVYTIINMFKELHFSNLFLYAMCYFRFLEHNMYIVVCFIIIIIIIIIIGHLQLSSLSGDILFVCDRFVSRIIR